MANADGGILPHLLCVNPSMERTGITSCFSEEIRNQAMAGGRRPVRYAGGIVKEAGPMRLEAGGTKKKAGPMRKEARSRPEARCRKQGQGVQGQGPGARTGSRHSRVQWTLRAHIIISKVNFKDILLANSLQPLGLKPASALRRPSHKPPSLIQLTTINGIRLHLWRMRHGSEQRTDSNSVAMKNPLYWAMLVGMTVLLMEQGPPRGSRSVRAPTFDTEMLGKPQLNEAISAVAVHPLGANGLTPKCPITVSRTQSASCRVQHRVTMSFGFHAYSYSVGISKQKKRKSYCSKNAFVRLHMHSPHKAPQQNERAGQADGRQWQLKCFEDSGSRIQGPDCMSELTDVSVLLLLVSAPHFGVRHSPRRFISPFRRRLQIPLRERTVPQPKNATIKGKILRPTK
ncbi:hypothetical protein EYF80_009629 [Liparis tanakae]|uniref:Uncharacterized protein n=1 Tax=Liparis tanakae TaxID=230148 RepID=A0A4Z2IR75_9TELE|nr:hypothetical protein EYF80_009629 [Liparis tanakae]